jgi:hypothetical protein
VLGEVAGDESGRPSTETGADRGGGGGGLEGGVVGEAEVVVGAEGEEGAPVEGRMGAVRTGEAREGSQPVSVSQGAELLIERGG